MIKLIKIFQSFFRETFILIKIVLHYYVEYAHNCSEGIKNLRRTRNNKIKILFNPITNKIRFYYFKYRYKLCNSLCIACEYRKQCQEEVIKDYFEH